MARETGFPSSDASDDFLRARRRQVLRRLGRRGDVDVILPFDEVIAELGEVGRVDRGTQVIALDAVVGTAGRGGEFDRSFRPTSREVRARWERIANAMRRGEPMPPVDVLQVGEVYFVRDGHHRVSVARALGRGDIEAHVIEVRTRVEPGSTLRLSDLPVKGHERLFRERVPLAGAQASRVVMSDPWRYGELAEAVEAWGFRAMQERGDWLNREETARSWFEAEFVPVVEALREAGLVGRRETDADAYTRLGALRYRLWRTMDWNDEIIERLRGA